MHKTRKERSHGLRSQGILGPGADAAFTTLAAPKIRRRVLLAHLVNRSRLSLQQHIGRPVGRVLLRRWMHDKLESQYIEAFGLPRHIVDEVLGEEALTLHVDPRKLIRIAVRRPAGSEKRPSSLAFIWEGSWDQRREDLRLGSRYQFISDLDDNRNQLERTSRYRSLMRCIEKGRPWKCHQLGVLLDTPEKILDYLQVYLQFLDDMAENGFDATRGKDPLGVAISRHGTILKVNRGLHRLAMAQRLGLPSVPVRVRHVHRLWWNEVTQGETGEAALAMLRRALRHCEPETSPGLLDKEPEADFPPDFWPTPRNVIPTFSVNRVNTSPRSCATVQSSPR